MLVLSLVDNLVEIFCFHSFDRIYSTLLLSVTSSTMFFIFIYFLSYPCLIYGRYFYKYSTSIKHFWFSQFIFTFWQNTCRYRFWSWMYRESIFCPYISHETSLSWKVVLISSCQASNLHSEFFLSLANTSDSFSNSWALMFIHMFWYSKIHFALPLEMLSFMV